MTTPDEVIVERADGAAVARDGQTYDLTLFVSGASELSARAISTAQQLCDVYLSGRCVLSIVDVHSDPDGVLAQGVFASPTLMRTGPPPARHIVGDLSDPEKVLDALGIPMPEAITSATP